MTKIDPKRPDQYSIFRSENDEIVFMTKEGRFVRELSKACAYPSWDDAIVALNAFIDNRDLGRDEPGIVVNAWRWYDT